MHKKTDFILGLILGGTAAVIAFNRLNPLRRRRLLNKLNHKVNSLKNDAIDYAFYANNELENTSDHLKKRTQNADWLMKSAGQKAKRLKNHVQDYWTRYSEKPASHLKSMFDRTHQKISRDDIVLNAGEALHNSKVIIYYPDGTSKSI